MNAKETLRRLNPKALVAEEKGYVIGIEDVRDPDGRWYRVEYRSTEDGTRATAHCLWNPWGDRNGGESYWTGHVHSNGFLCLGTKHTDQTVEKSPYSIEFVVKRSRYWCTAFSYLKEHGAFPNDA